MRCRAPLHPQHRYNELFICNFCILFPPPTQPLPGRCWHVVNLTPSGNCSSTSNHGHCPVFGGCWGGKGERRVGFCLPYYLEYWQPHSLFAVYRTISSARAQCPLAGSLSLAASACYLQSKIWVLLQHTWFYVNTSNWIWRVLEETKSLPTPAFSSNFLAACKLYNKNWRVPLLRQ
jgi:hypothetical protein